MKFAFPILTAKGEEFKDVKALTALINGEKSGHYLLGNHNKWHMYRIFSYNQLK